MTDKEKQEYHTIMEQKNQSKDKDKPTKEKMTAQQIIEELGLKDDPYKRQAFTEALQEIEDMER